MPRVQFPEVAIRFLIEPILIAVAALAPLPAFAYSCAVSPAKDAVIVKTDNTSDRGVTCKVDCTFRAPDGPVTFTCSQQIPPGAKGWYVCLRPTGGKALEFVSGSESCNSAGGKREANKKPRQSGAFHIRLRQP